MRTKRIITVTISATGVQKEASSKMQSVVLVPAVVLAYDDAIHSSLTNVRLKPSFESSKDCNMRKLVANLVTL